jgi:hypothetical protein
MSAFEGAPLFCRLIRSARTCTMAISEEFALDEVLRNGGAVQFDEDAVSAQRLGVHGAGDEFFAGTGLAVDEHTAVRRGHQLDLLTQSFDGDGFASDGSAGELPGELLVILAQAVGLQGVAQDEQRAVHGEWFLEEVVRAQLGGTHCGFDGSVAGDHDDLGCAGAGGGGDVTANFGKNVKAVAVG